MNCQRNILRSGGAIVIPKIIHYCWFGGAEKSALHIKCIESWKKYLPDYEIKEWNESNFDVNSVTYVKQAYDAKKYAFVSDYVRLYALDSFGGIYFDLDVEVKKNLNGFLSYDAVFSFESVNMIASAVIFAAAHNKFIEEWLESYKKRTFLTPNGYDLTANVYKITEILTGNGFLMSGETQIIDNICLCEKNIFCPYGIGDDISQISKDSYTIHWCEGSWFDKKKQSKLMLIKMIKKIVGTKNYYRILKKIKAGR